MICHLLMGLVASGTYYPSQGARPVAVVARGKQTPCYRLNPGAELTIEGPAKVGVRIVVDLPKKPKRPRRVPVTITLDGDASVTELKLERAHRGSYDPPQGGADPPSKPAKAIKLVVPSGSHALVVALADGRSGCLALTGATLAEPPPPRAPAPEPAPVAVAEPPPSPEPAVVPPETPAPAPATATPPGELPAATATTAEPTNAAASGNVEVITAQSGEMAPVPEAPAAIPTHEPLPRDLLRFGVKGGGVLPRGDLAPTFYVGGIIDLSLRALGIPVGLTLGDASTDLDVYVEGGWNPFTQQDTVMIQGRGRTSLIQNSLVLPFEVGARFVVDLGFGGLQPYLAAGLAMDVTRTELRAFSLPPEQQNDFALGFAAALGTWINLGPGAILVELRYREVQSDLGSFAAIAENAFANFALHAGYVLAIGG